MYKRVLHKVFSRIPDMTAEEVDLAVDSVIHENEHSLKDAMKDTATKDDIRDIESRMATKDDIKDIESKMTTKTELAELETRLVTRILGLVVAMMVMNLAILGLMLRLLLSLLA